MKDIVEHAINKVLRDFRVTSSKVEDAIDAVEDDTDGAELAIDELLKESKDD